MILRLIVLAAVLLPASLPAQVTFQRTYGLADDDCGQSVVQTADGGYYLAGYTYSTGSGGADVFVIATDAAGDERWTQVFGGAQDDMGFGVTTTANGDCLAAGYLGGSVQADVALHGNTAEGGQLWIQVYGGSGNDMAYSVDRNSDGGFVIAGVTYSFGSGRPNAYLLRTDSLGDTLWTRAYGGAGEDYAFSARQTADSGFIICGTTYSYGAGLSDIYLVKTDAAGDTEWTRAYGGADAEHGHSVLQAADSGYIVCGITKSFGAGGADVWLIRTDSRGDTLWTRTFGGDSGDYGHSVAQTSDGGFVVAGQVSSHGAGGDDVWLIKTDFAGDTLWTQTFGGEGDDRGYSVRQTADGGYVVCGVTNSFGAGGSDFWLIKTDSSGRTAVEEPQTPPVSAPGLSLSCSPNPASGSVTISLSPSIPSSLSSVLRLFDASGRLVLSQPVRTSSFTLHPSSLPAGVYLARLDCGAQHASTRLVLQR